jgi:hypothetical protein
MTIYEHILSQNVNPGLQRRFSLEEAFQFVNYSDGELLQALEWKMKERDLSATDDAKATAIAVLARMRNRPNFGNIGEVETLLSKAKVRWTSRQSSLPAEERSPDAPFEAVDFDANFDRDKHAATNLAKLFEGMVGCEEVIKKLDKYQKTAKTAKARGRDPRDLVPMNFLFKGPPGAFLKLRPSIFWLVSDYVSQERERRRPLGRWVKSTSTWDCCRPTRSSSARRRTLWASTLAR